MKPIVYEDIPKEKLEELIKEFENRDFLWLCNDSVLNIELNYHGSLIHDAINDKCFLRSVIRLYEGGFFRSKTLGELKIERLEYYKFMIEVVYTMRSRFGLKV